MTAPPPDRDALPCLPLPDAGAALPEAFLLPPGLYLDGAGHGPRLRRVQAAARAALEAAVTPWTRDWAALLGGIERVRGLAARLFDGDADGVALVPSAAYALSVAAANVPLQAGQAVLVLDGQFPSNLLPWQRRCQDEGARLHVVDRGDGDWTPAVLHALAADAGIAVVAVPQLHWRDGALLDLDAVAAAARARGATLVLDLSQSLGVLPVDIARWQPDFIASVGYKWLLGPDGLAYLWAAPRWRAAGAPIEHGWFNRQARADWRFPLEQPAGFLPGARRYDAGGQADTVRLAMAAAGLEQVLAWREAGLAQALALRTQALADALAEVAPDVALPAVRAPHVLGLRPPAGRFQACADALARADIAVTARHGVLRIAPHLHAGVAEMRQVARVLAAAS